MQPLSIRTILIVIVSSLTLLIGVLACRATFLESTRISEVQSLQNVASTCDHLFEASTQFTQLRSLTYPMLYGTSQAISTLQPQLLQHRILADAALEQALVSLDQYNIPQVIKEREATQAAFMQLKVLRQQIDHEMTLPPASRNHKTLELWHQQITQLILQTHTAWLEVVKRYRENDPTIALHIRLKQWLAITLEYMGREDALIGRLLAQNATPTPSEQADLLQWHGATQMAWTRIIYLAQQGNLTASVSPYIKETQARADKVHNKVWDRFYAPTSTPQTPLEVTRWLTISSQIYDATAILKQAVTRQTNAYVETLKKEATFAILLNIAVIIFSISVCFYSFWVISFRVLKPIDNMVKALVNATHGNPVSVSMDATQQDEIGKLARILHTFQENAAQTKQGAEKLQRYTNALERSNKELDDFAYIASHDLKEPLRGIHNHSRFLLEDNETKLDKESVDRLGRLIYLSQRMERLVNDLLYFSRLGRQELAIQQTDLNEVIHDIESTLDMFITERHAHITIPKPLPTITCDITRITEAFRNLITNAVKYNDKAEKHVEIGFLEIHHAPDGVQTRNVFYVKDDGNGIPEEFYTEVFRIFKRLQSSKNKEEEGTGVGLTFVKKIIERHGGKVWLTSVMGEGTTFYFTLEG